MKRTLRFPSEVLAICQKAGNTKKFKSRTLPDSRRLLYGDDLVLQLMRSERQFTAKDMSDLADYWEGKLNRKRGRSPGLDEFAQAHRLADKVKDKKRQAKEAGKKMKHDDAIDKVIEEEGYPAELHSAIANKLANFMKRSKRTSSLTRKEKLAQ